MKQSILADCHSSRGRLAFYQLTLPLAGSILRPVPNGAWCARLGNFLCPKDIV